MDQPLGPCELAVQVKRSSCDDWLDLRSQSGGHDSVNKHTFVASSSLPGSQYSEPQSPSIVSSTVIVACNRAADIASLTPSESSSPREFSENQPPNQMQPTRRQKAASLVEMEAASAVLHKSDSKCPVGNPFEEITSPSPPSEALLQELDGRKPASVRSRLPVVSGNSMLNEHLAGVGLEVDGFQPFEILEGASVKKEDAACPSDGSDDDDYSDDDDDDDLVLDVSNCKIKERHAALNPHQKWNDHDVSPSIYESWMEQLRDGRLLLDGQVIERPDQRMRKGQKLEYIGSTDGDLCGAVALHMFGRNDEDSKKEVMDRLVEWLADKGELFEFFGRTLRDYVSWELLMPSVSTSSNYWEDLLDLLRKSFKYLVYTGADWLLLVATAHVFAPVTVLHYQIARAVRFIKADAAWKGENGGYIAQSQLPASCESWLVLGLLPNHHFVRCRQKRLSSEIMLRMIEEREVDQQVIGEGKRTDSLLQMLRLHADKYDTQLSEEVLSGALKTSAGDLDAAIKYVGLPPRFASDAVIIQGPSGTGKSTWINLIAGKTEYDDTPPARKEGEWCEPALAVLGQPLHKIGRGAEAETLHISGTVIRTHDDETPYLEVIDTPGMFDTRGPLIEVVNAILIAKCMPRFKSLRIVVMVRGSALEGRGEGFASTAETMAKLFETAGGAHAVRKNVMLWVNPHAPKAKYDAEGVVKKLKDIKEARGDIAEFVQMLIAQSKRRPAIRVLEYDKIPTLGAERKAILRAKQQHYPHLALSEDVFKVAIDREEIIEHLIGMESMKKPAEKCGIPLSSKATAEIAEQSQKLHQAIALSCQMHDYARVRRYLDVCSSLSQHMCVGAEAGGLKSKNSYQAAYQDGLAMVKARLSGTCSKSRMAELSQSISGATPLAPSDLHSICLSMRTAAAASVLEGHANVKECSVEMCSQAVCNELSSMKGTMCQLLNDHFISRPTSGVRAAQRVFEEQIPQAIKKFQLILQIFESEAAIEDSAGPFFSQIAEEASISLSELHENVLQAIEGQSQHAERQIGLGMDAATEAASHHFMSLHDEERSDLPTAHASSPFDIAAEALQVIKMAEDSLVFAFPELKGKYAASCDYTIGVVSSASEEAQRQISTWAGNESVLLHASNKDTDLLLEKLFAKLLFLLHARSSHLNQACDSDIKRAQLDACYESSVNSVVEWHGDLINDVLKDLMLDPDQFVKNISSYRAQIEFSMELVKLSTVENVLPAYARTVITSSRWNQLKESSIKLSSRIENALMSYASTVEGHLRAHNVATSANSNAEEYDYRLPAKDIMILEKSIWCDTILKEAIIEQSLARVWEVFEKHSLRLKEAVEMLRSGKYDRVRSQLVQLHNMERLYSPFLAVQPAEQMKTATFGLSAYRALIIKEVHDDVEKDVKKFVAEKCEKMKTKVLRRIGPMGAKERPSWWMDLSISDANLRDALAHLEPFLCLSKHLLGDLQGQDCLNGWLQLHTLENLQLECRNEARKLMSRLQDRVSKFFCALGRCVINDIDEALNLLGKETSNVQMEDAFEGASNDEQTEVQTTFAQHTKESVTLRACSEISAILEFLSCPSEYPSMFDAARERKLGSNASPSLMAVHDLERKFRKCYMDCQIQFGNEDTKPEARQKAILIFSTLDYVLPPDEAFQGFHNIFSSSHTLLVNADQVAKREMSKELKSLLLAADFSDETRQLMLDSQALGKNDERAHGSYVANCNVMVARIRELLDSFDMAIMHLKIPDPTFNVQDQLVKPWNQLYSANLNVAEFLKDSSSKAELDLEQRLKDALTKFEKIFKEEVLQVYARMFDMCDFCGAEGNASSGLMRVSNLVVGLQMAHGGELGQVARDAYIQERNRQKCILQDLHVRMTMLKDTQTLEQENSFEEQLRVIEDYLRESFDRRQAIQDIPGDCELILQYKQAAKLIVQETCRLVSSEFSPLFQGDFLSLSQAHVNYLDNLLSRILLAPFRDDVLRMLPTPITGGSSVEVAKQNISTFRSMKESIPQENLSSLAPHQSDSVEAIKSKIQQQAKILLELSVHSPSYARIVKEFSAAFVECINKAQDLLGSPSWTIPPGRLDAVFAEMRERRRQTSELRAHCFRSLENRVEELETRAFASRMSLESWLLTSPTSPLINSKLGADSQDDTFFAVIQAYSSMVSIAPASSENCKFASQIMDLIVDRLQKTLDMCFNTAVAPQDLALKKWALQTLRRWEPCDSTNGTRKSVFDIARELETALGSEGWVGEKKISTSVRYDEAKQMVYKEALNMMRALLAELGRHSSFIADQDPPLEAKAFELIFSRQMHDLIMHVGPDLEASVDEVRRELNMASSGNVTHLQSLLASRKLKEADQLLQKWKFFEPLAQSALLSAQLNLPGPTAFQNELQTYIDKLEDQTMSKVQTTDHVENWEKQISAYLLNLAKCGSEIPRAAAACGRALNVVLEAIENKFGVQEMGRLATELRERDEQLGQEIIRSSNTFAYVKVMEFNVKTQRDISVVKELYKDKNSSSSDGVWSDYDLFKQEYDKLITKCTDVNFPVDDPRAECTCYALQAVGSQNKYYWGSAQQQIPKVLAGIFAWWSMDFFEALRKRNPNLQADPDKLLQPNSVQVVCILKLLGGSSKMTNHLAEVPTGEGKSVILGVLATTLALYGFSVDCVCYSQMLSSRDFKDFMPMFEAFKVLDSIRYGTFDTLSEDLLTEQYGDLRKSTNDFLSKGKLSNHQQAPTSQRVLIIDEVDVFCSKAFFGGAYCPSLTIRSPEISQLMRHIWSLKFKPIDINEVSRHQLYQAVIKSGALLPKNEWLLKHAVHEMHKAARTYSPKMHDHIVRSGKIWYRVEGRDQYAENVNYIYETNAEYIAEFEKGELTEEQMCDGLALHVRCGEFSFAKLPELFKHILGVTGTLDASRLPPDMHTILKSDVGIKTFTYCPSMYHASKRDWQPNSQAYVHVAKDRDEHYNLIVDEIDKRLLPTTQMEGQRSVLVFFRSEQEIIDFRASSYFRKHRAERQVLTELSASRQEDRDHLITNATRQGAVTLATRMYGRGTDFKINDLRMEKAGGMHVIQTFFSRDLSEEVQIMGRCARQGDMGSYSLVLLSKQEDFDVTKETVEGWEPTRVYHELSQLRTHASLAEMQSLREMSQERKEEHDVLANSLASLRKDKTSAFGKLLKRYNSSGGLKIGTNGIHVVFCLDESGSMDGAPWEELIGAFKAFWIASATGNGPKMFASVIQFSNKARVTHSMLPIEGHRPPHLVPAYGGTAFHPAAIAAESLIDNHGPANGYAAVVIFMSDGHAPDASQASKVFHQLAEDHQDYFQSHTVGFGSNAPLTLETMAFANGQQDKSLYRIATVGNLAEAFAAVAKSISPCRS